MTATPQLVPAITAQRSPHHSVRTPLVYDTVVTHVRSTPLRNAFSYKGSAWLVDLDALPDLPAAARPFARFDARDHFDGTAPTIRAGVDRVLAAEGIDDVSRVLMLANPRVLGYVFNPLSVHWCHRADGSLACTIAEVHNTYGERHAYVVRTDEDGRADVAKAFYVSPFFDTSGRYVMSLPEPGDTLRQSVTLHRDGEAPFVASVRGVARPGTTAGLVHSMLRTPGASLGVAIKIRTQGVRLWWRRLPVIPRPVVPEQKGVTR